MHQVLMYVRVSPTRECFAYLILSFALSWIVWIPVLLASRRHEQLGDLLIIGTFGPALAATLLSYQGVRVPSKLSSRFVCFGLALLLCWAILMGHARLWDELRPSFNEKLSLPCYQPFQLGSSQLFFHGMAGYAPQCGRS